MTFNALDYLFLDIDDMTTCVLLTVKFNWNKWLKKGVTSGHLNQSIYIYIYMYTLYLFIKILIQ